MRIQPGVYLIRNKRENTYIGTETGYGRAGTKAMLDDWNMQGTQKVSLCLFLLYQFLITHAHSVGRRLPRAIWDICHQELRKYGSLPPAWSSSQPS